MKRKDSRSGERRSKGGATAGKKKKSRSRLIESNPIAQLQKIQLDNGNIDMKVVVAMQRRKFLMNAVVGEMNRREQAMLAINEMEEEGKRVRGKMKLKILRDIREKQRKIDKSFGKKQKLVQAMKVMIDKYKDNGPRERARREKEEMDESMRNVTLQEAIDIFGKEFDLRKIKEKKARMSSHVPSASPDASGRRQKLGALKGICSRGGGGEPFVDGEDGKGGWYDRSAYRASQKIAQVKGLEDGKGRGGILE